MCIYPSDTTIWHTGPQIHSHPGATDAGPDSLPSQNAGPAFAIPVAASPTFVIRSTVSATAKKTCTVTVATSANL